MRAAAPAFDRQTASGEAAPIRKGAECEADRPGSAAGGRAQVTALT